MSRATCLASNPGFCEQINSNDRGMGDGWSPPRPPVYETNLALNEVAVYCYDNTPASPAGHNGLSTLVQLAPGSVRDADVPVSLPIILSFSSMTHKVILPEVKSCCGVAGCC